MKDAFIVIMLFVLLVLYFSMYKELQQLSSRLKEPCAVYDVTADYVIISEEDIAGINR